MQKVTGYEKELQKNQSIKKRLELNKTQIQINLYVNWKGHNNLFHSWIDKKTQYK